MISASVRHRCIPLYSPGKLGSKSFLQVILFGFKDPWGWQSTYFPHYQLSATQPSLEMVSARWWSEAHCPEEHSPEGRAIRETGRPCCRCRAQHLRRGPFSAQQAERIWGIGDVELVVSDSE